MEASFSTRRVPLPVTPNVPRQRSCPSSQERAKHQGSPSTVAQHCNSLST